MRRAGGGNAPFQVRGLEFHSTRMWDWESVQRALEFMSENGLNLLAFHKVNMLDELTCPEKYLPESIIQRKGLVRLHTIQNNREYIRQVIRHCHALGIQFMIEIKEINFPDQLLSVVPELWHEGHVCPSHPFWWDFLEAKAEELLHYIPEIDGAIVSPATRESKLTVATGGCTCERCQSQTREDWYFNVLNSLNGPLQAHEKELVVRDFAYEPANQIPLKGAIERLPEEVVVCIKNTPHDFYPTFPDNPLIGDVGDREQWLEYDVWGQYFGWGTVPCSVLDDLRARMKYAVDNGVSGFLARIDLEIFTGTWGLNTINRLNLVGISKLGRDLNYPKEQIYRDWIAQPLETPYAGFARDESGQWRPVYEQRGEATYDADRVDGIDIGWLQSCLEPTWEIMAKGTYHLGHVFHDDTMFPYSIHKAWWTMETKHSLCVWDPSREADLELTSSNVERVLQDRKEALELMRACVAKAKEQSGGLKSTEHEQLVTSLEVMQLLIEGFGDITQAWVWTRWATERDATQKTRAQEALDELSEYGKRLKAFHDSTRYPHYVYLLADFRRVEMFVADATERLGAIEQTS